MIARQVNTSVLSLHLYAFRDDELKAGVTLHFAHYYFMQIRAFPTKVAEGLRGYPL